MFITFDDLLPSKLVNTASVSSFAKKNTPTAEELAQVKIELGMAQEKKKKAAPKRKYAVMSSSSEATSTAPLIPVFTAPLAQRKRSKKTMALADVVSPAPFSTVQPEVASSVVVQQVPVVEPQETQAPPSTSVTVVTLAAQPILPRTQSSHHVKRIMLSTAVFAEPPPPPPRRTGVIIQEPDFVSPFAPKPVTYQGKGKTPMEDRPNLLSPAVSQITLVMSAINKAIKRHMDLFDYWVAHRSLYLFTKMLQAKSLDFVAPLEERIFVWAECNSISAALSRRAFVRLQLREALMVELREQRNVNFDGMSRTVFDDVAVLQHLDQNIVLFSSQQRTIRDQLSISPTQPEETLLALQVQAKAMILDIMKGEFEDDFSDIEVDEAMDVQPLIPVEHVLEVSSPHPVQEQARDPSPPPVQPQGETAPTNSVQALVPEVPDLSSVIPSQPMIEPQPVESLPTVKPSPILDALEVVGENLKGCSPPPSPIAYVETIAPALSILPPPIVEDWEASSPGNNSLALFESRIASPNHAPTNPSVTNDQLQLTINNLFSMIQKSSLASTRTDQTIQTLRQTVMNEISILRRDSALQSSNLSEQVSQSEQRLEAKIDTIGTQLSEIITFLAPVDDKKGEEEARRRGGSSSAIEPRRIAASEYRRSDTEQAEQDERFRRQTLEDQRKQLAKRRSGSSSKWFKR